MKHKKIIALLVLVALLVFYFYKVVFFGRVLSAADNLFSYPPYTSISPIGWQRSSNELIGDQTYQFYPFLYYARENIKQGHLPLWNPYILMGAPFLADAQSAELYPVNIVFYALPFRQAFAISAFLRLLIAGLGMYLFASALGIEFIASLFAAVVFMFCAFNIVWLNHPQTNVSIFLPWLFFFIHRFMKTGYKEYIAGLALVTGIQFLGGHPETSAHILFVASLYLLVLAIWEYRNKKDTADAIKKIAYIGIAFILGFLIASPMLLPFLSELSKSATWTYRAGKNTFYLPLYAFLALFMPNIYGSPINHNYWGWANLNFNEQSGYIGIIALILAGMAIVIKRKDRHVLFFSLLALGALLVVYGIPPFFQAFNMLPMFNHMINQRLLLVYQFSMIVLAGIGLDIFTTIQPEPRDTATNNPKPFITFETMKKVGFILTGIFISLVVICIVLLIVFDKPHIVSHIDKIIANFYTLLVIVGLFIVSMYIYQSVAHKQNALVLILIIAFLDLFYFGHNYNPEVSRRWVYPQAPKSIFYMQNDRSLFRFIAEGFSFIPNSLMVYHIDDVRGYDFPVNKRYDRFFTLLFDQSPHYGSYLLMPSPDKPNSNLFAFTKKIMKIFQLINVKYVGDLYQIRGDDRYRQRAYLVHKIIPFINVKYVGGLYQIREDDRYRQRAYLVHTVIPASTPEEALGLVDSRIDALLKDSAVIEEKKKDLNPAICEDVSEDRVRVDSYHPDRVKITTFSPCQAILVLSDTYDSGWKVYVDGVRKRMLHANYLFRGVFLEPGRHRVTFAYQPFAFTVGVLLCVVSLIIVGVVLVYPRKESAKDVPKP